MDVLRAALAGHGLRIGGVLDLKEADPLPAGLRRTARSIVLVSAAGTAMWPYFSAWRARQESEPDDPLDTWSRVVIGAVAEACGCHGVFPSDKPYMPFQSWAMRATGLKPSPLGLLIHPDFGLWHAFRGAIVFDHPLRPDMPDTDVSHPCDTCREKPCLSACPVNAVSASTFDFGSCRAHLKGDKAGTCMQSGCLARNACPVGAQYRYSPDQQAFHQQSFIKS